MITCHVISWYVYVIFYRMMQYHIMSYHTILCHFILCHIILYHILYYIISYYTILYHIILCHFISHQKKPFFWWSNPLFFSTNIHLFEAQLVTPRAPNGVEHTCCSTKWGYTYNMTCRGGFFSFPAMTAN